MQNAVTVPNTFSDKEIQLIKDQICRGASNEELELFVKICKRTGLDPFARQIYSVERWDNKLKRMVHQPQTSVDGLRLIAERSGKYEGQTKAEWCGEDGVWKDVWLSDKNPSAARIGVHKAGHREATYAVARWQSYAVTYRDKMSGQDKLSPMWTKMPDLMLAKCAESLALRKAFPNELSGVYSGEEMEQAAPVVAEVIKADPLINEIQYAELTKTANELGLSNEEARQVVQSFGIETGKLLRVSQLEVFRSALEKAADRQLDQASAS